MDTKLLPGQNVESSITLQQQPCHPDLPPGDAGGPKTSLKDQPTASARPSDAEKVIIPDMFVSWASQKPSLNPHYELVKLESEASLKQLFNWTEKEYQIHIRIKIPYLTSLWAPDAGLEELRHYTDWLHWIRVCDDLFDEGELCEKPENARKEVEALIEIMRSPNPVIYSAANNPLRYFYQIVWQRVQKRSSPGTQRRFVKAMKEYFSGIVGEIDIRSSAMKPDIENYIALRRESIGVTPGLVFIEIFAALDIPDEVFEHPSIRKIETLASDIVTLQNDVCSFHKEQSVGVNHNIIHLFRQDGLSQQQAYDQVDLLIHKAYHAWYVAHSEIPIWGEEVDAQVMLYVKGCQDMVLGNLNWSFASERYFGKEGPVVRKTRVVSVVS